MEICFPLSQKYIEIYLSQKYMVIIEIYGNLFVTEICGCYRNVMENITILIMHIVANSIVSPDKQIILDLSPGQMKKVKFSFIFLN